MPQPAESYPALLSLAVHELRTPANVVGGYLRMLQRDAEAPLGDRQRKMVEEAERSCARMVALISELSDIGKLDAGQLIMTRLPTEVFALVQEVADGVHEAEDRAVFLAVRGTPSAATIHGDVARLTQALRSILRAVLRETGGPATVVVDRRVVRAEGQSFFVLIVAESSRVQGAYDEPRLDFDEKRGGLGLALPLARRVVEAHGGRIWSLGRPGAAVISFPLPESP